MGVKVTVRSNSNPSYIVSGGLDLPTPRILDYALGLRHRF